MTLLSMVAYGCLAGFVDVAETKNIWPSNRWLKDRKLKELGMFYILTMDTLLNAN
ncbi:hypothetical protein BGZ57DRAFT_292145 [Hyaloscypha finlandica]|nr:hypothetical protein BGZ57DRAFT_292145 [Hyaloscypha finlandica]